MIPMLFADTRAGGPRGSVVTVGVGVGDAEAEGVGVAVAVGVVVAVGVGVATSVDASGASGAVVALCSAVGVGLGVEAGVALGVGVAVGVAVGVGVAPATAPAGVAVRPATSTTEAVTAAARDVHCQSSGRAAREARRTRGRAAERREENMGLSHDAGASWRGQRSPSGGDGERGTAGDCRVSRPFSRLARETGCDNAKKHAAPGSIFLTTGRTT